MAITFLLLWGMHSIHPHHMTDFWTQRVWGEFWWTGFYGLYISRLCPKKITLCDNIVVLSGDSLESLEYFDLPCDICSTVTEIAKNNHAISVCLSPLPFSLSLSLSLSFYPPLRHGPFIISICPHTLDWLIITRATTKWIANVVQRSLLFSIFVPKICVGDFIWDNKLTISWENHHGNI